MPEPHPTFSAIENYPRSLPRTPPDPTLIFYKPLDILPRIVSDAHSYIIFYDLMDVFQYTAFHSDIKMHVPYSSSRYSALDYFDFLGAPLHRLRRIERRYALGSTFVRSCSPTSWGLDCRRWRHPPHR